jgi:flagellar L-ring protein FlgH
LKLQTNKLPLTRPRVAAKDIAQVTAQHATHFGGGNRLTQGSNEMQSTIQRIIVIGLLVFAIENTLIIDPALAQDEVTSMFERADPNSLNMFGDTRAARKGDLITIFVREKSNVQNTDQRKMKKSTDAANDNAFGFGVGGVFGSKSGDLSQNASSSSDRTFDGNSQFNSQRGFVDQFTVTVIDVLPNGNLLVGGRRQVQIEGDDRSLVLTGIVRGIDVASDNSVSSSNVANLEIKYEGSEKAGDKKFLNQGWLGKKVNKLWPY